MKSTSLLMLAVLISCTSNNNNEPLYKAESTLWGPPGFVNGGVLSNVSREFIFQFFGRQEPEESFEAIFTNVRVTSGDEVIESLIEQEGAIFHGKRALPLGTYQFKFDVPSRFNVSRLQSNFTKFTDTTWGMTFVIGYKFSVSQAHLCRLVENDGTTISKQSLLSIRFTDEMARINATKVNQSVSVTYNGETADCKTQSASDVLSGIELTLLCNVPSRRSGELALNLSSTIVGINNTPLTDYVTGGNFETVKFTYDAETCSGFTAWAQ